jgi:hypothetical protein
MKRLHKTMRRGGLRGLGTDEFQAQLEQQNNDWQWLFRQLSSIQLDRRSSEWAQVDTLHNAWFPWYQAHKDMWWVSSDDAAELKAWDERLAEAQRVVRSAVVRAGAELSPHIVDPYTLRPSVSTTSGDMLSPITDTGGRLVGAAASTFVWSAALAVLAGAVGFYAIRKALA